jgi:hypothetical protein
MYYFVCILATGHNGTFYVGVTNDLLRPIWEHTNACILSGKICITILHTKHALGIWHRRIPAQGRDDKLVQNPPALHHLPRTSCSAASAKRFKHHCNKTVAF